jgi:hypothetical protein
MDRLAYRVLAGPGVRLTLALQRLAADPERQTRGPALRSTAAQARARCAARDAR